ncbi:MAG: amino acid carrier protein, partial [Phycisphaeraceae bacterium]
VTEGARSRQGGIPFIVIVLLAGGLFFTLRFGLVHLRMFGHGLACTLGRYDDPRDKGEISHFQALSSALSATLGLGNIAGVAIAIAAGGPGAVFWMWLSGFLGMSMKFCECTLSQVHRRIGKDGHVLGGPMVVIADGLGSWGGAWKPTAKVLAAAYAVFIICAAFGVALFQTKTSYGISAAVISPLQGQEVRWTFGVALALLVGIVIIGGIRRIGSVASKIVPAMCVFYVAVCLVIILANLADVPALIGSIFAEAFTGPAIYGGFIGVLIMGMRRGMFSNEAGIGSAAIAHAAARTREPVREGLVAMLGPFIDTIVICSMTALTILITAVHLQGEPGTTLEGAVLTATAFAEVHWMLGYCLVPAVLVFAY